MEIFQISIILLINLVIVIPSQIRTNIFCYYHMSLTDEFDVSDIDLNYCSHLIYDDFKIDSVGNFSIGQPDVWFEGANKKGVVRKLGYLKVRYADLKILASIGQLDSYVTLSNMMRDSRKRRNFVQSTIKFLKQNDFDGFDFAWINGKTANDRRNHALLAHELKDELTKHKYILALCVEPNPNEASKLYNIQEIAKYSDFLVMRTFELRRFLPNKYVGFDSALYPMNDENNDENQLNIKSLLTYWIEQKVPAEKIIIHISSIGRKYLLKSSNPFLPGSLTLNRKPESSVYYNEICSNLLLANSSWMEKWNDVQKVPFAYTSNIWINYENIESVRLKTKFALDNKLGGISFGPLQHDDFKGNCGNGKYPLLKEIYLTYKNAKFHYQYYVNVTVTKRNIRSGKTQRIYHKEKELDFENDLFSI